MAGRTQAPPSILESITSVRQSLQRLGIPEPDVKLTWDTEAHWARFRARLPGGATVTRTLTCTHPRHPTPKAECCVAAVAAWLRETARKARGLGRDRAFEPYWEAPEAPPWHLEFRGTLLEVEEGRACIVSSELGAAIWVGLSGNQTLSAALRRDRGATVEVSIKPSEGGR